MTEKIIVESPVLFKMSGAGRPRQWMGQVVEKDDGLFYSRKVYGQRDGKQVVEDSLGVPKNVGKANETSSYDQALKEMKADEAKKRKGGYNEDCSSSEWLFKPMKLHTYLTAEGTGKRHKFDWSNGAYVSLKYNGICYLVGGDTSVQGTRGLELYSLPFLHLRYKLDYTLIGELYIPGKDSTYVQGILKRQDYAELSKCLYAVFDCHAIGDKSTFEERRTYIESLDLPHPYVKHLGVKVNTEEEAITLHNLFVSEGEEGTVLREPLGLYQVDYRSYSSQRIKDSDTDYVIIEDIISDARGGALFNVLLSKHGEEYRWTINPTGELEERKGIYENKDNYVGKTAQIIYYQLGAKGIPLFSNLLLNTIK